MQHEPADRTPHIQHFRDSANQGWRVFEREKSDPHGRAAKVLIFESGAAFRCVRNFPENWRELSTEALERLSWGV